MNEIAHTSPVISQEILERMFSQPHLVGAALSILTTGKIRDTDPDPSDPNKSYSVDKISEALSKAQGEMDFAKKGKENPHFKNKYADMGMIIEACQAALSKNGIAVTQTLVNSNGINALVTRLFHSSGQWIKSEVPTPIPANVSPQQYGSFLSYYRRYSLMAICCIGTTDDISDDDGESSQRAFEQMEAIKAIDKAKKDADYANHVQTFRNKYSKDPEFENYIKHLADKMVSKGNKQATPEKVAAQASNDPDTFEKAFSAWKAEKFRAASEGEEAQDKELIKA
jgi:hypothetical protein